MAHVIVNGCSPCPHSWHSDPPGAGVLSALLTSNVLEAGALVQVTELGSRDAYLRFLRGSDKITQYHDTVSGSW